MTSSLDPSSSLWLWVWAYVLITAPTTFSLSLSPAADDSKSASSSNNNKSYYWNGLHFQLQHFWTCPSNNGQSTERTGSKLLADLLLQSEDVNIGFVSKSQAKRACQNGAVWILNSINKGHFLELLQRDLKTKSMLEMKSLHLDHSALIEGPFLQAHPSTILQPSDEVWIMVDRQWKSGWNGYPVFVTKNWLPPPASRGLLDSLAGCVLYEDDEIAMINKPKNLTTISNPMAASCCSMSSTSDDRDDLQSLLGFLLQCPIDGTTKFHKGDDAYQPRPVHRLDKPTSGLVLVAKSARAMKILSKAFAERQVTKTYSAIVLHGGDESGLYQWELDQSENRKDDPSWYTIDYPINGKSAISSWRLIRSISLQIGSRVLQQFCKKNYDKGELSWDHSEPSDSDASRDDDCNQKLSLLQVRPHTGRTHQIRRHLAYNLGSPIVGDTKYYAAGGQKRKGPFWKDWHTNQPRMYLCCHELEFPYDLLIGTQSTATMITAINSKSKTAANVTVVVAAPNVQGAPTLRLRVSIPLPSSFHDLLSK
ncbi:unnamed protein product [Cylindrotheca closterium]|uniref:Pseudouridine synthase RsuA/RluA-like domain-containing protein n=1 Tax=Cylindrotheca closterium TaxID=2856 RepID=A0AAD2FBY1_9STRA|nr:unnamed protein product [Cylindrotheca closterium]